jgi:hypothetical protein
LALNAPRLNSKTLLSRFKHICASVYQLVKSCLLITKRDENLKKNFIHSGKLYSFHVELYSPLHNLGMKNNTLGSAVNGSKLFIRYEENFPLQQTESVGKQTQTARCNSFHAPRINTARQTHPQIKFMSGSFSHRTFAITFLSF